MGCKFHISLTSYPTIGADLNMHTHRVQRREKLHEKNRYYRSNIFSIEILQIATITWIKQFTYVVDVRFCCPVRKPPHVNAMPSGTLKITTVTITAI